MIGIKKILLLINSIVISFNLSGQLSLQWVKSIGGSYTDVPYNMIFDEDENIYVSGFFSNTVDFDPGLGEEILYAVEQSDGFIAKYNSNGEFIWVKAFSGSTSYDVVTSIALDEEGNIYAVGGYSDTMDFDPGPGIHNLIAPYWGSDGFILKLDSNGNFIWVKSIEGMGNLQIESIVLDKAGNVICHGRFYETADFDPGPSSYIAASQGMSDFFILNLSSEGEFNWVKTFGSVGDDQIVDMGLGDNGSIYACGRFDETIDFDPNSGIELHTASGYRDAFILKLDSLGNYLWVNTYATQIGSALTLGLTLKYNEESIYFGGTFDETIDLDAGENVYSVTPVGAGDVFFEELDTEGNLIRAGTFGGVDSDNVLELEFDGSGNMYLAGAFKATVDFDMGIGEHNATAFNSTYNDFYVLKLDPQWNFQWVYTAGGQFWENCNRIHVGYDGSVYALGSFFDVVDFDPTSSEVNITSFGYSDMFVLNLKETLPTSMPDFPLETFNVYPIPFNDQLNISNIELGSEIRINSILGREVLCSVADDVNMILNLKDLEKGVYLLYINDKVGKKIIKN